MAMVINSNIASLTSQRHLSQSRNDMEVAMERMSSGSRINSSWDDAAGLAIGNRMTSQIEGLNQAIRNANDGISLAQTAEGALDAHSGIMQRMRVLAVQAANDTYSTLDRKTLNNEVIQLKEELNRGVSQATFNGQKILDGTNASFTFQVGHTASDTVTVALANMAGSKIGTQTWADKSGTTAPTTASAVTGITTAIPEVDTYTYSAAVTGAGGKYDFVHSGTTYSGAFVSGDADGSVAMGRLATAINAASSTLGFSAVATNATTLTITATAGSGTQMTAGAVGGSIPATSGTAMTFAVPAITEVLGTATYAVTTKATNSDSFTMTVGGNALVITMDSAAAVDLVSTATKIKAAWDANDAAVAAYTCARSGATLTFSETAGNGTAASFALSSSGGSTRGTATAGVTTGTVGVAQATASIPASTTTGVGLVAEQESYDLSSITLAQGDRISLTIGSKTYTQDFATDQATTLSALGALVVNGESGYESKAVTSGKLVFTGAAAGTAMAAATMKVETGTVTAANSVDDVIITDSASAKAALSVLDNALEMMADFRSRLGASSNRMFHTVDNLMNVSENTSAARSRIMDADFAKESADLAKSQILQKAGTAMLSQANASTQDILNLLK